MPPRPTDLIRNQLVGRVRAVFNDVAAGQQPVAISNEALFERDSPTAPSAMVIS